jgi:predicted ATPase
MIERLYVHNYRCFENFTLDLKGKPSALVIGRNGSGKSTLRHALSVLQWACQSGARMKDWLSASDFCRFQVDIPMRFEVDIALGQRRYEYRLAIEWSEESQEPVLQQETLVAAGVSLFSRHYDELVLGTAAPAELAFPGTLVSFFGGAGGPAKLFREFFRSVILVSPLPALMSGYVSNDSLVMNPDAGNVGSWLSSTLTKQPARYVELMAYLQAVMPDVVAFEFEPRGGRAKQLRVQFESKGAAHSGSLWLDFDQLSDGEKCLFLSAAVVAFNRKEKPLFCFWDEPDNHLSLPEVGQFITELRKSTSQHGQFIATSHHPEAIRRFSDENTFVFTRNSHLEPTVVRPLTELPYGTDLVRALVRGEVI